MLQRKYAVTLATLVGGLLLAGGAAGGWFAYREAVAGLEAQQRAQATLAAAEIAGFMARVQEALRASVAKFDGSSGAGAEALRIELASLLRHHPELGELRWIDPDGREQFALRRFGLGGGGSDPEATARWRRAREGGPVAEVWFNKGSEPHVALALAGPAGSVLGAELNLAPLRERLALAGGSAYVVDGRGRLILHPDPGRMLAQADLSALPQVRRALASGAGITVGRGADPGGAAVIAAGAPVAALGWAVLAEQPRAQALRPVVASVTRSAILMLLGLAAAVAASALLARRLVRPIRVIEAGARRLGEGRYDERIELRTGDELEALAGQFNRMAESLQQTHAQQEQRIAERTQALALANEAKTRFLAVASHDLRQPLHALALFAGQLRTATLPPDVAGLAHDIDRSVQSLQTLVEALLDLSQLDAGAVQAVPEDVALAGLFDRLALTLVPIAQARGLRLRVRPTTLGVRSDPRLLERILLNLAGNALHYTPRGGVLIAARRRGDEVELRVADTGVGIAAEHLPHLFREFYRADPAGTGPGLGLGLAIVQRLCTLLGHRITLASEPGRGTCVTLRLPGAAPAPRPASTTTLPADPLRGRRVLVVDDDPAAREALCGTLVGWACEVHCAAGPDEALVLARAAPADLALCDLSLGDGRSGLDLAQALRAAAGPDLRCAIVTGDAGRAGDVRAAGLPVLIKPVAPAKLRALLERLLQPA